MAEASESRAPMSRAELRRTEGLAASLRRDRAEVLRWKDENPLRLVAAALVDVERRAAKRADIREKLAPEIISPDEWDRWWSRIQPTMKESRHFSQDARHAIRLRARPSEIEPAIRIEPVSNSPKAQEVKLRVVSPKSPQHRLVEWITWAQSDEYGSAPGGVPPDVLVMYLRQQPSVLVPTTVSSLSRAIDEKILSVTPSSRPLSLDAWLDLLAMSLARCADLPADRRAPMVETVGFCARLTNELGTNVCKNVIESLAKWTSASAENVLDMADAILINSRQTPHETGNLLQQLHDSLGGSARKALWMRLVTSDAGQVSDWLIVRWLRIMRDAEKSDMVSDLLPFSRVARILKERIKELREENERLMAEHRREITEKDRLISDTESELERAGSLEVYLRGELRKAVNIAALSFTRDAILILGETLQDLSISSLASHQEIRDAKARITLSLLTLGAKPFGEIGESVPFDSSIHQASQSLISGAPVTVAAPGLAYFKNVDTPQTMVKMKVKAEERA